jgi:hypothetical protein
MSGKELLNEVKKKEDTQFIVVKKPIIVLTSTIMDYLSEVLYIVVNELPCSFPPIRSISHQINLIPGASLPNKATYRLMP